MNKTIIININGTVFHIEEDAYEILKNYMTNVKRHFMNSADSLEITTDIENRIAEMFNEILLKENKQVIIEQDVTAVTGQMGNVEDFDNPEAEPADASINYATGERKLFRDPDDHLVSGVCAGIASYFDIRPLWVRLVFAIAIFGAASGLVIYIILWIAIPKARTRADRMAMRGEKLNLAGFKNNLQEELSNVRNNLNNLHEETRPTIYRLRDFLADVFRHVGLFFGEAGKLLVKLLGILMLLVCFAGAILLIVTVVGFAGFGFARINHVFPMNIVSDEHAVRIYITAFFTLFIPVVALIIALMGAVFKTRPIGQLVGSTLLIIWVCALCGVIFYVSRAVRNFRYTASFTQTTPLKAAPDNTYYLKLNDVKYLTHEDSINLDVKDRFKNITLTNEGDDDTEPNNVTIRIEHADVNQPEIVEAISAKGRDYRQALLNARNSQYLFIQQDSVLKFDRRLLRPVYETWHDEHLELTIKMPLNAKLVIDQALNWNVDLQDVNVDDCKDKNKQPNATSATYLVTADGAQCKIDTLIKPKTAADSLKALKPKA